MTLTFTPTRDSNPEDALKLPEGNLAYSGFEQDIKTRQVVECAKLIIDDEPIDVAFTTQAEVISYAGNNLGWGESPDFQTF